MAINDEKGDIMFIATILFGWAGIYRFSKKQFGLGVIYLFTVGLFGIGWIIDIVCAYNDNKSGSSSAVSAYNQPVSIRSKQFLESLNIIQITKEPSTFFSRYEFALKCLDEIEASDKFAKIEGQRISTIRQQMNNNKQSEIMKLLDRTALQYADKIRNLKTHQARVNNIDKFLTAYEEYLPEMSANTQNYYAAKRDELFQVMDDLEA